MITISEKWVVLSDVTAIAKQQKSMRLDTSEGFVGKIEAGALFIEQLLAEQGVIYGVTTGFGDSCVAEIPAELVAELPDKLFTFHGCGTGEKLSAEQTRAVLMVRLVSLCKGFSGVRFELLVLLAKFIEQDILPLIPSEGSVGASGDLTPLSYVAAALSGRRQVSYRGTVMPAGKALDLAGLTRLKLKPKETLAIMNGTAVMTALACQTLDRAKYLALLSGRITSLASLGSDGNPEHFDKRLFEVKPHKGQQEIAGLIRQDLASAPRDKIRLQDRYSIRCAPHIIGVLQDCIPWLSEWIENELNSVNDNPIIDPEEGRIHHGGHFYGGHIAFAMDSLKNAVANIADLMDRQVALLVDTKFNEGMPPNLTGAEASRRVINHGFKALQIAVSAWTAEALKLTMPASVFSRSTECHNQDKVSMGTIAARDCLRVLQLTEQVAAAGLMIATQAVSLRCDMNLLKRSQISDSVLRTMTEVNDISPFLAEDRELDLELEQLVSVIQQGKIKVNLSEAS